MMGCPPTGRFFSLFFSFKAIKQTTTTHTHTQIKNKSIFVVGCLKMFHMRLAISHQDRPFIDLPSKFSAIDNGAACGTPVPFVLLLKSSTVHSFLRITGLAVQNVSWAVPCCTQCPGEMKRREVSWTLKKKLAQKGSRGGR